ncbi:MAG TPA: ACT domain-containing protein [Longimicrobiaceae bacterium]|nr:ACT domain-containing protein [Longimicrobiaceae bacterium]
MLDLTILPETYAVCRLAPDLPVPAWAWTGEVACVARTRDELSVICAEPAVPAGVRCEPGWRCLRVEGPLAFGLTGILSSLVGPLAEARIPIFAFSTYDTDYVLVKAPTLPPAVEALEAAGHRVAG